MSEEWTSERIAELRRITERTSAISGGRGDDAAFDDAINERTVLSLLDELERERGLRRDAEARAVRLNGMLDEAYQLPTIAYLMGREDSR